MSVRATASVVGLALLASTVVADSRVSALDTALQGRSWMAQQQAWPCHYHGSLTQQRSLSGSDRVLRSSGKFWFDCQRGLIWELSQPRLEVRVYTNSQNDLIFSSGDRVRPLDGLVDRQVGGLMRSIFSGNYSELADTFSLEEVNDDQVRLAPRSKRVAAHLGSLTLAGDETQASVSMVSAGEQGDSLFILLTDFAPNTGASSECRRWLDGETSACDGVRSPLRYLQR